MHELGLRQSWWAHRVRVGRSLHQLDVRWSEEVNRQGGSRTKLSRLYLRWDRYNAHCWTLGAFGGRSKAMERLYKRLVRLDYADRTISSEILVWEAPGVWRLVRERDEALRAEEEREGVGHD